MLSVPFFDYPRLWIDERKEMLSILDSTASSGGFIMQEELTSFEKNLAKYTGSKFAVGVGNATDAMEIFLQAIGVKDGDEIIISSHTMLATASAIVSNGAKPIPVDIGSDNLIDPKCVEEAISTRTVGVMPTQLNGRTCNMDVIQSLADKHNLFVVEDAAQSLGSKFKEKNAGTFGLASCISFFPAKVLGCLGDAGAALVNDENLYKKIYEIHDHGRGLDGEVNCWGRNSRLDNLQAAILDHKLKNYKKVIDRRREIATIYNNELMDIEELILPPGPDDNTDHFDVYQNYELQALNRDTLKDNLSDNAIGTLIQWGGKAVHQFTQLGFKEKLPNTERFFERCLMLPMNVFLSDDQIMYVCSTVRSFYQS